MYTIYHKRSCPYCQRAIKHAKKLNLPTTLVEISDIGIPEVVRQLKQNGFLKKHIRVNTVPIVFQDEIYIGGSDSITSKSLQIL